MAAQPVRRDNGDNAAKADDAKRRAAATYDVAADRYDDPANSFWELFGQGTIDRLNLQSGERVLDACCGTGASALPAARRVGPAGQVLGIDLSQRLVELARAKAQRERLRNVEFRLSDLMELDALNERFDAVVCVFGIFFVPDMVSAARALWHATKPGGRLAVTTWGPRLFEPLNSVFWDAIRKIRPALYKGFNPWDRICDETSLSALLRDAGIATLSVEAEFRQHALPDAHAWWSLVLGSGYRWTVEQLSSEQREQVRRSTIDFMRQSAVRSVETNVLYAIATKK